MLAVLLTLGELSCDKICCNDSAHPKQGGARDQADKIRPPVRNAQLLPPLPKVARPQLNTVERTGKPRLLKVALATKMPPRKNQSGRNKSKRNSVIPRSRHAY